MIGERRADPEWRPDRLDSTPRGGAAGAARAGTARRIALEHGEDRGDVDNSGSQPWQLVQARGLNPAARCRVMPTERQDATELLEIAVSESGGVRRLRLTGELDMAGVDRFERLLTADQTSEATTFVLDMRGLTFIDSSGLRALIMADRRVRAEGAHFVVVRGPDRVNQVLEMTGVAQRIDLVDEPPAG